MCPILLAGAQLNGPVLETYSRAAMSYSAAEETESWMRSAISTRRP